MEKINKAQRYVEKPYGLLLSCNPIKNIIRRVMYWLLLYCCDKTPQPRKLPETRVYLGLWFQKLRVHDGRIEARPQEQKCRDHVLNHKCEAKRKTIKIA